MITKYQTREREKSSQSQNSHILHCWGEENREVVLISRRRRD